MNTLHLKKYVEQWMFLQDIPAPCDDQCIVFDTDLPDQIDENNNHKLVSLRSMQWCWIWWKLLSLAKQHRHIIFIMTETSLNEISDDLDAITNYAPLLILNTNHIAQRRDLWVVFGRAIHCLDPVDLQSFQNILVDKQNPIYCRIQPWEYPQQLIDKNIERDQYVSVAPYWLQWNQWTVLCFGRITHECLHALHINQEQWWWYDCFFWLSAFLTITDQIRDSLLQTERLVLVWDHDWVFLDMYAKNLLYSQSLYDIDIQLVTPIYEWITTLHPDYFYEQAWFWVEQLVWVFSHK